VSNWRELIEEGIIDIPTFLRKSAD